MQVTVEHIPAPQSAFITSNCFSSLARSSGSNLEKHQFQLNRTFPGKTMRKEPDTMISSQDSSLRLDIQNKHFLKEGVDEEESCALNALLVEPNVLFV